MAFDNSGLSSTGQDLWEWTASSYDLLGYYDSASFIFKRNIGNPKGKMSRSFSGYFSLPYGYWTFIWSSNRFEYEITAVGLNQSFKSSGTNTTHTAEINRVIHRDDRGKTILAAFLTKKNIRNFIEEVLLVTGSRRLTIGGGRLSHVRSVGGGIASASVTGEFGLPILDALRDKESTDGAPRAQFTKWAADVSYFRPFHVLGQRLTLDLKGRGQWSPHTLYPSERINPGGQYTVRGFRNAGLNGDVGAYIRNELAWTIPLPKSPWVPPTLGYVDAFVGFDMGWLEKDSRDPLERGRVAGWAIGLRAKFGHIFGEAILEKPLASPSFLEKEAEIFRFQAGSSFRGLRFIFTQLARWIARPKAEGL